MDGSVQSAPSNEIVYNLQSTWGLPLEMTLCASCDWRFLVPHGKSAERCPHCFQTALSPLPEDSKSSLFTPLPELLLPFQLTPDLLTQTIRNFSKGIPFAPRDLTPDNLNSRLRRLYLPVWLVDALVEATWQAEVGFDYLVVSHQDQYDQYRGGWSSQEVNEGRIRWEPRLGRLKRTYQNIATPALEEQSQLRALLGDFPISDSQTYQPQALEGTFVRVPDRSPQDAWSDAKPAFLAIAAEECRKAANADHIRQFSWKPEFSNQNWSLLLLPIYTGFYLDDNQNPQPILIHGQTGWISGTRRASLKRGQRAALTLLGVAFLVFLLSLLAAVAGFVLPALLPIGVIGIGAALLIGLCAIIPVATVWWFNRSHPS